MERDTCWRCGGAARLDPTYCGKHWGKLICSACGRWVSWARPPMTEERAAAFRMPWGKYRNSTLAELAEVDVAYLRWLATECESNGIRRGGRLPPGNA